jgi:hypothetical protein
MKVCLLTIFYALIFLAGAWWSIGESAERCAFADTVRMQECR